MSKHLLAVVAVLAIALMGSRADAQLGKVPPLQLVVVAASSDATYVYISGVNFGSSPAVFLGGIALGGVAVNAAETEITALMPAFPPGTYLLHVSSGEAQTQNDTFGLTVGAVGPQGATGDQGQSDHGAPS